MASEMERKTCPNCGHELTWYVRDHYLEGRCYHCLNEVLPIDIGKYWNKKEA